MTAAAEKLVQSALELDETERGEVVARLLTSLEVELDPDARIAWEQELERRAAELESGQRRAIPWEEVERRLLARQ